MDRQSKSIYRKEAFDDYWASRGSTVVEEVRFPRLLWITSALGVLLLAVLLLAVTATVPVTTPALTRLARTPTGNPRHLEWLVVMPAQPGGPIPTEGAALLVLVPGTRSRVRTTLTDIQPNPVPATAITARYGLSARIWGRSAQKVWVARAEIPPELGGVPTTNLMGQTLEGRVVTRRESVLRSLVR